MRRALLLLVVAGAASAGDVVQADSWQRDRVGPFYRDPWGYGSGRLDYGWGYRRSFYYPGHSWNYGGVRDWSPQSAARLQRFELRQNLHDRWLRHRWDQNEAYNRYYGLPSYGRLGPRRW